MQELFKCQLKKKFEVVSKEYMKTELTKKERVIKTITITPGLSCRINSQSDSLIH